MEHKLNPTPSRVAPNPVKNPEAAAKIVMGEKQFVIPRNTAEEYNKAVTKCLDYIKLQKPPENQAIQAHNFGNNSHHALQRLLEKSNRPVVPGDIQADKQDLKAASRLLQDEIKKSKKPLTPKEFANLFLKKLEETQQKQIRSAGTLLSTSSGVKVEQQYNTKTGKYTSNQKSINSASVIASTPSRFTSQDINANAKKNLAKLKQDNPQATSAPSSPSPVMTPKFQPNSWVAKKKLEEEQKLQASAARTSPTPFDTKPKPNGVISS